MEKKALQINGIPSVLWGNPSEKGFIAVHGNQSHKMDRPIELLAENACARGYQVVSFDLPEHGDRKQESTLCKVQNCVEELREILQYAEKNWKQIRRGGSGWGMVSLAGCGYAADHPKYDGVVPRNRTTAPGTADSSYTDRADFVLGLLCLCADTPGL